MSNDNELKPIVESLIFASVDPISVEKLANILEGRDKAAIKAALSELVEDYKNRDAGFYLDEVAGGYAFRTRSEFSPWIRRLFKIGLQKLSKAAMESIAIVAYRQPITRAELEAVRGVDSAGVLSTLMEKRLVKIVGRKEVPGRPVVYGTTKEFLETFDLKDLSCLPSLKDIQNTESEFGDAEQEKVFTEGREARPTEAPEDNSGGRDNLPEEGRGADPGGPGHGEPEDGGGTGDKGRS